MNRFTFVVQIHPDGPSTLENLSTQERVRVSDLATVGPQIEQWLELLTSEAKKHKTTTSASNERSSDEQH